MKKNMIVVVAPDSFKETLTSLQAARAIRQGFRRVFPGAEYRIVPIADGGEGTVTALVQGTGGRTVTRKVTGPLGKPVRARFGLLGDGTTAVIEMAEASGLALVPPAQRNPLKTTTFGTGELILDAVRRGACRIILGIGGSATVDGGTGLAQALGIRFLDKRGRELGHGGAILSRIAAIDASGLKLQPGQVKFEIACDVTNPLVGPKGAACIYGPQKGASPVQVKALDAGMKNYITRLEKLTGRRLRAIPGSGAAGGLGVPLIAFYGAGNVPGIELVLDVLDFKRTVKGADLVVTCEGRMDGQSVFGKAPIGVARAAAGVPVIAINGCVGDRIEAVNRHGITAWFSATPASMSFEDLKRGAAVNLAATAEQVARVIRMAPRRGNG